MPKCSFCPCPACTATKPSCLKVCPTGATYKTEKGLVLIDHEKCIGCRACIVACPYESRQFLWDIRDYYRLNSPTPFEQIKHKNYDKGTAVKCTFCAHRLEDGQEPACVLTCPGKARTFGDLDDPESDVSKLILKHRGRQFRSELGTEPAVYYIRG
jgi:molybdopterin-containing oxidoreductase family iron-sulfur binding subunit